MKHASIIAACDRNDGVTDGVINDPRSCLYDPAALVCKAGDAANFSCVSSNPRSADYTVK